jgi:uncharacterized protein (TIGR00369 family)
MLRGAMTRFQELIDAWVNGRREPAPVATLVGFRLVAFENGTARIELQAGTQHHNPMGIVHGGILCDLADAAMGVAIAASLEDGESFATVQLSASFLRSTAQGLLTATGRVTHRGRSVRHADAEITDADGRPIARVTTACLVTRSG